MGNYLTSKRTIKHHGQGKTITEKGRVNVRLEDLPEDVLGKILSKLPAKEVVRTSVLSSKWRCMRTVCPKLSFNGVKVHTRSWRGAKEQYTRTFIDNVNAVLQEHHDKVVEELDIKFEYESMLVDHLNNWINFAVSSRTKNLAFDLAPAEFGGRDDRYIFPFELLNSESISCLQCIQLSFVSFKPPSQFKGFPNLRKLDLNLLHTTRMDLEDIVSNCCNLEWLSIVRCHLKDELKVIRPLSHLQYLQVMHCNITKIEFHATKLSTFVYKGRFVPVILHHASKLENANIWWLGAIFQHAVAALLNGLPNVQNLTLHFASQRLETQWVIDNPRMFSQLRHVQLLLLISHEDIDKILYLVSFLSVTPIIEKLEVHFGGGINLWLAEEGPQRHELPQCEYKYLKNVHVTGYRGARGQLEFLTHVVENAPAIELMTVDTTQRIIEDLFADEINPAFYSGTREIIRQSLLQRLRPEAKLSVL